MHWMGGGGAVLLDFAVKYWCLQHINSCLLLGYSLFTQHAEWANACIQYFSHTYKGCVKMCPHCIDDQPRRRFSITGLSGACTSRVKGWKQSHQCMDVFALCECARGCWSVNTQTEEKEDARTTQTSAAIIVRKIFILGICIMDGCLVVRCIHTTWFTGRAERC